MSPILRNPNAVPSWVEVEDLARTLLAGIRVSHFDERQLAIPTIHFFHIDSFRAAVLSITILWRPESVAKINT